MLLDKSIIELSSLLNKKLISSEELIKESLSTISDRNSIINAFITTEKEKTLISKARQSDKNRTKESSIIHGLPFSLKDAYITKEMQTTAASNVLKKFVPPYNATVNQKLLNSGAILVGKNNMDSWGHGGSTENTDFGSASNPWDTTKVAGGSSGGSAAAVAARMVSFAIGEDTGGSIRNPASMCNVSGLKVTYGRVSRYGSIAYASSFDTVGPMAKSAEDLAALMDIIAGSDPFDATSSHAEVNNYSACLNDDVSGKIIGLPKEFFTDKLDPEVKTIIDKALLTFQELGAKVTEVSIPSIEFAIPIYYLIALSETSSNLARYDGVRYGKSRDLFTEESTRRILLGTYALSAGYAQDLYKKAQKARTVLINEYQQAFKKCDVLLGPVTASPPLEKNTLVNDPARGFLEDLYTVTINPVGVPSLAIPAGFSENNLPVGMQLIGKKFSECELLNLGHKFQQVNNYHKRNPNESAS